MEGPSFPVCGFVDKKPEFLRWDLGSPPAPSVWVSIQTSCVERSLGKVGVAK